MERHDGELTITALIGALNRVKDVMGDLPIAVLDDHHGVIKPCAGVSGLELKFSTTPDAKRGYCCLFTHEGVDVIKNSIKRPQLSVVDGGKEKH